MPNASVSAVHVYPVKSVAGATPSQVTVEPWGLAGDRRWLVAAPDGRMVTQREQPRLALAGAEPLPDGGIRLTAPGRAPLTVAVPVPGDGPTALTPVRLFRQTVELVPAGAVADDWLSGHLGTEARLFRMDDPARRRPLDPEYALADETVSLADGFPLQLATTASLHALNSLIAQGDHADEGPLPMNRFRPNLVVDGTAPWAEDEWRRVRVGEVAFRIAKSCGRCVVTTTDQRTGERGKEPLRTLARHRRVDDQLLFGRLLVPEPATVGGVVRVGDPVTVLD